MRSGGAGAIGGAALAVLAGLPGAAQELLIEAQDFLEVCPAALMAPDTLAADLQTFDLGEMMGLEPGLMTVTGYETAGGSVAMVGTHTFSDATHGHCSVSGFSDFDEARLATLREALEAHPLLGPLEGSLAPVLSYTNAYLKAPGTNPIVIVGVIGGGGAFTLTLEVWTIQ